MSIPSPDPPSFDAIFSSQPSPPRRDSSQSSQFSNWVPPPPLHDPQYQQHPHHHHQQQQQIHQQHPSFLQQQHYQPNLQQQHPQQSGFSALTDEPGQLHHRRNSGSGGRSRAGSAVSISDSMRGMGMGAGVRQDSDLRKESLPFDVESSTLIATAPKAKRQQSIGDIMFGGQEPAHVRNPGQGQGQPPYGGQEGWQGGGEQGGGWSNGTGQGGFGNPGAQQPGWDQHAQHQFAMAMGGAADSEFQMPNTAGSAGDFSFDAHSPYVGGDVQQGMQGQAQQQGGSGDWSAHFLGQGSAVAGDGGQGWETQNLGIDQEQLNELERIISNASSAGSQHPSREPSPFQQLEPALEAHSSISPDTNGVFSPSPSASPFPSQMASPYQRPGTGTSPQGSPYFNKPQSPPALIIPNQPSPASLPPIVTDTASGPPHRQQAGAHPGLGGVSGGLLPPVNPALEHLSGMMGISPIAPNADGPQIYIQPSTPISGLKEGRGVFDFRKAVQQQQQGGQQGQQDQQQSFNVPPPQSHPITQSSSADQSQGDSHQFGRQGQPWPQQSQQQQQQQQQGNWNQFASLGNLDVRSSGQMRPRAKSDSAMASPLESGFDRAALLQLLAASQNPQNAAPPPNTNMSMDDWRNSMIDAWRTTLASSSSSSSSAANVPGTLDPRQLPGQDTMNQQDWLQQLQLSQQFSQLQAQRNRLPTLNTNLGGAQAGGGESGGGGTFKYQPGEFSPTSLAFYHSLGINPTDASQLAGTVSAPFHTTTFQQPHHQPMFPVPNTAGPSQASFLSADLGLHGRRRSFAGGENHPAAGAGTPGYGNALMANPPGMSGMSGRVRGVSPGSVGGGGGGHRRGAKSEDLGRGGSGWGMGAGGSTTDFLQSITANDGTLLPPSRGRASSHSGGSSNRSASPALSISSQGSSFSQLSGSGGHMDMPEGMSVPQLYDEGASPAAPASGSKRRVAKMKVTSMATEVASTSRRTNDGVFKCPIPGCGSTFTRHFNLKGHLRSHNDERPYKCLYDGCPKATVGFARQHDCKRHMLLHEGLRPFECEGCGKKFARLDALTRHLKSEQGQECALTHPLPVNPDGSPMSESQYKAYRQAKERDKLGLKRESSYGGYSGDERSGAEDIGTGSGMEDYDRA